MQQGVPVRLEVGPRDIAAKEVKAIRRVDGHKEQLSSVGLGETMTKYLDDIHHMMFEKAKNAYDSHIVKIDKFDDMVPTLDAKNVVILPWCEREACEDDIKERSASV